MINFLLNRLEQDEQSEQTYIYSKRSKTEQKIRNITRKRQLLFDSYLEQDIDREAFLNKKAELLNEKKSLSEFLANFEASQKFWVESVFSTSNHHPPRLPKR